MSGNPSPLFASIALVGNDRDTRVVESMQILAVHLHSRGRKVFAESDSTVDFGAARVERQPAAKLAAEANLVVAIGGDGTMLHAARLASPHAVPVLGVNRGRLGFLADIGSQDVRDRLDEILEGRYVQDQRAMLTATLTAGQRRAHRPGAQRRRAAEVADRPHARLRNLDRRPLREHAPRRRPRGRNRDRLDCLALSAAAARFSIRSWMRWCSRRSARTRCRTGRSWSAAPRAWRSACWNARKRRRR